MYLKTIEEDVIMVAAISLSFVLLWWTSTGETSINTSTEGKRTAYL